MPNPRATPSSADPWADLAIPTPQDDPWADLAIQPQTGRKMGWLEAMGQGVKNLPGGLASQIGQLGQMAAGGARMLTNPAHAAEVLTGAFQQGQQQGLGGVVGDIGRDYKEAWGGAENIKQTLANDPVRLLMDASALLTGGGGLATRAGLGTAGKVATTVGRAIDPAMGAYKLASGVARKVGPTVEGMQKEAGRLWESGVKPSKTLRDKNPNVNFGIEGAKRGRVANEEGMEQANTARQGLADTAKDMRRTAIAAGEKYQPFNVARDVEQQRNRLGSQVGRVAPAKAAYTKAVEDFLEPRQRPITVASSIPSSARLQFGAGPVPVGQSGATSLGVPPPQTVPTHRSGTWTPTAPAAPAPAMTVTGAPTSMPTPPPPVAMRVGRRVTQVPLTPGLSLNTGEAITSELGKRVQWSKKNPLTAGSQALSDEARANEALYRASKKERDAKVNRGNPNAAMPYEQLQRERGTEIALAKAMDQAMAREQNRNILSGRSLLGTAVGGIGSAALFGPAAGPIGGLGSLGAIALLSHLDNPAVKTRLANRLYKFGTGQPGRQQMNRQLAGSIMPGSILARLMSSHEQP